MPRTMRHAHQAPPPAAPGGPARGRARARLPFRLVFAFALAVAAVSAPVAAQPQGPGGRGVSLTSSNTPWSELNARQKVALAPLQERWAHIAPEHQQKWLEIANRFSSLPKVEQERIQERMTDWAQMTPQQRSNARMRYQEARRLEPNDRQAKWEQFQALTPEQRMEFSERALQKSRPPGSAAGTASPGSESPAKATSNHHNSKASSSPRPAREVPVAPAVVQAKPGATTTLITRRTLTPQSGKAVPHIGAASEVVDRTTLLPRKPKPAPPRAPEPPPVAEPQASPPPMPEPDLYK